MEEVNIEQGVKKNFDFVDTIRCIGMIGIVFEHSTFLGWFKYENSFDRILQVSSMQFFKFATISFFLIAGFLINHKFAEYTPYEYLKKRFKSTIGPWFIWLNVFILINIVGLVIGYLKGRNDTLVGGNFTDYLATQYLYVIFGTSFWFILNFLICIAILLIFKKHLYSLFFGGILGLISLFYSVNVYYEWIPTRHTMAMFGFVFYLWLGAYLNKHYFSVEKFIKSTSIKWFILAVVVTFIAATAEILNLKNMGVEEAYNTLIVSNIMYSLCFFFLLLKIGPIKFINQRFLPRKTTYGIYLIHQILISYLLVELFRPFNIPADYLPVQSAILYSLIRFLLVYSMSMLIVRGIMLTRFKWIIGD